MYAKQKKLNKFNHYVLFLKNSWTEQQLRSWDENEVNPEHKYSAHEQAERAYSRKCEIYDWLLCPVSHLARYYPKWCPVFYGKNGNSAQQTELRYDMSLHFIHLTISTNMNSHPHKTILLSNQTTSFIFKFLSLLRIMLNEFKNNVTHQNRI